MKGGDSMTMFYGSPDCERSRRLFYELCAHRMAFPVAVVNADAPPVILHRGVRILNFRQQLWWIKKNAQKSVDRATTLKNAECYAPEWWQALPNSLKRDQRCVNQAIKPYLSL